MHVFNIRNSPDYFITETRYGTGLASDFTYAYYVAVGSDRQQHREEFAEGGYLLIGAIVRKGPRRFRLGFKAGRPFKLKNNVTIPLPERPHRIEFSFARA